MKHIIIIGNVVDGLTFVGPFEDSEAANEYGMGLIDSWVVAEMREPSVDDQGPEADPGPVKVWPWPAEPDSYTVPEEQDDEEGN